MRTALILFAFALGIVGISNAADTKAAMRQATHIDAQPLDLALQAVAKARGVVMVYRAELVTSMRTSGANGDLTLDETLTKLLYGTRLAYKYLDDKTITIVPTTTVPAQLSPTSNSNVGPHDLRLARPGALVSEDSGQSSRNSSENTPDSQKLGTASLPSSESQDRESRLDVVVTGTRLRGVETASPVLTLDQSAIIEGGYSTLGQALQALPENFSGGQTPTNIGAGGIGLGASASSASSPNLRGLGPNSTLTLIDGHRLAFDQSEGASDLALIPVAAIASVEIETDGSSALYGSDAVGGVVNVRLKKNYTGAETSATIGRATDGGGLEHRYSQLFGISWGSGHLTTAYEYNHQDPILTSQRSYIESATPAGTISPELRTHSAFVSLRQDIVPNISFFAEGVYTNKYNYQQANYQNVYLFSDAGNANQYGVAAGFDLALPKQWLGSFTVTKSGNNLSLKEGFAVLPAPAGSPSVTSFDNQTTDLSVEANGSLFSLGTGDVRAAIGGGMRWETIASASEGYTPTSGSRNISYGFGEVSVPIVSKNAARVGLNALDFDAAVRYEDYSDVGGSTVPKFGLIYRPFPDLEMKGTWSESFRAPTLYELYSGTGSALYLGNAFGASGPVLITYTPVKDLVPERSKNWTVSGDFRPAWLAGAGFTVTYFNIDYSGRIGNPIAALSAALTNPVYAPFVIRNPTAAQQHATISTYPFYNYTGVAYDPSDVAAIFNNGLTNISVQSIHGVDVTARYSRSTSLGTFGLNASGSWLNFVQEILPGETKDQISGTIFNPPKFKSRVQGNWSKNGFGLFLAFNYVSSEYDNISVSPRTIASWTTADAGAQYDFGARSDLLHGLRINIAALNIADRRPPYVDPADNSYSGHPYDPSNASAVGRTITATITKDW